MHSYAHFLYIAERYEESLTLFDETVSLAHEAFGDLFWLTQSIRLRYDRNLAKRERYEEAENRISMCSRCDPSSWDLIAARPGM